MYSNSAHRQTPVQTIKRRAQIIYALMLCCAVILATDPSPNLHSLGAGVAFPGGGYLVQMTAGAGEYGFLGWGLIWVTVFFAIAMLLWFATGNIIAPAFVWIVSAFTAAISAPLVSKTQDLLSGISNAHLLISVCASVLVLLALKNAVARPYKGIGANREALSWCEKEPRALKSELDQNDLGRLRFLLDRALQQIDEFNGFEGFEQFQPGALRYQLNFAGLALAMVQKQYCPAFQGYLTDAQRHLIEKQRDPRVWNYWALENLWGHGKWDPNPFARDNIMYTGFCATQIAAFQGASGDFSFSEKGAFTVGQYQADFPTLISLLKGGLTTAKTGLIACEPHWVFPLCNAFGLAGIPHYDLNFKSNAWEKLAPSFEQNFKDDFTNHSGHFITGRSSALGFALPAIGGALTKLLPCFFLSATLPDYAREQWHRYRPKLIQNEKLNSKHIWPLDVGNYRLSRMAGLAGIAMTATELGDEEARRLCLDTLEQNHPAQLKHGVFHRKNASVWAHSCEIMARCGGQGAFANLMKSTPQESLPFLKTCNYPDILVAKAIAQQDQLEAILHPGSGAKTQTIIIGGLKPGVSYHCNLDYTYFQKASAAGEVSITFELTKRTKLRVKLDHLTEQFAEQKLDKMEAA